MATTSVPHEIGGVPSSDEERRSYAHHVNPIWVKLLDALGMIWIDALNLGRRAMSL